MSDTASGQEVNIDKQRLGEVYAAALLAASEPKQQSDAVLEELDGIVDEIFSRSPEFESTLSSPRVSIGEKETMLDRVFSASVSELLLTFLKVVGKHGRLDCLRHIRTAARQKLNEMRNRVAVQVTTASALSDDQRHTIQDQLQRKMSCDVDLDCRIDESILGGIVIRVGDTVFDSSVSNRLDKIKEQTLPKTYAQLREAIDRFAVSG